MSPDVLTLVQHEMAARAWTAADLVAACAGSPSRATIYYFLAGVSVSRRSQANIVRAMGHQLPSLPRRRVGAEIRRRREDLGLSMPQLAARVGLHADYLGKLERGEVVPIPLASIIRLAPGLGGVPEHLDPAWRDSERTREAGRQAA